MDWNYKREEDFEVLPEGEYRVRVHSVEKAVSKKGNDMLKITFDVNGTNKKLFSYITFLKDNVELTNRLLTSFFDSFKGIPEGEFNTAAWVGKQGAVHVKHEKYNDTLREKVQYFIKAEKQDILPAWKEPSKETTSNGFVEIADVNEDDLPF